MQLKQLYFVIYLSYTLTANVAAQPIGSQDLAIMEEQIDSEAVSNFMKRL